MARLRRLREGGGGATVEFALVFPIFIAIIATVMFVGWLGAVKGILDHGVREAARYVSVPCSADLRAYPDDPRTVKEAAGTADDPCPGSTEVAEVVEKATPLLSVAPADVTVTGGGSPNAPVTVTVSHSVPNPLAVLLAPLELFSVTDVPGSITLESSTEVRRE